MGLDVLSWEEAEVIGESGNHGGNRLVSLAPFTNSSLDSGHMIHLFSVDRPMWLVSLHL